MFTYNDGLLPGGRSPRLYLAKGTNVKKFTGENIPDYCAVVTAQYEKAGKWSNTDYSLMLSPGVRPLHFVSPLHGVWGDALGSWGEVAERLQLPIETAKAIVRFEFIETASRLDKLEEFAVAGEEKGNDVEVVVISFGAPTNRQIAAGWWAAEKVGMTSGGRTVTIKPGKDGDWENPIVVEPEGAKIISATRSPGMHGGYRTVEVAVIADFPTYAEAKEIKSRNHKNRDDAR
jgi:hypothetical protein